MPDDKQSRRVLQLLPANHPEAHKNFWTAFSVMVAPSDRGLQKAVSARAYFEGMARIHGGRLDEEVSIPVELVVHLADRGAMARLYGGADQNGARNGCIAGFVLTYLHLLWCSSPKEASLNKAIHLTRKHAESVPAWGGGGRVAATPRQILKIWEEFRCVAHLWLAWNVLEDRVNSEGGIEQLLSIAEGFRLWLEGLVPYRARRPLAEPYEMWRPEAGRVIPFPLKTHQAALPESINNWLQTYRAPTSKFFED